MSNLSPQQIDKVREALYGHLNQALSYYKQQEAILKDQLTELDKDSTEFFLAKNDLILNVINQNRVKMAISAREAKLQEELKILESVEGV